MEKQEYKINSFVTPNFIIKKACEIVGITEEDYYNTLAPSLYDTEEENEKYKKELVRKIFNPTLQEMEEDWKRWEEDGAKVMSVESCVNLLLDMKEFKK